jgi:hypothetical protein
MTEITALTIVRTLPRYKEANQYGAMRMSCRLEGKEYGAQQFYDLGPRMTEYQALELAAQKLLDAIAS